MSEQFDIAVIGGGFSGLMVVANIMRREKARPKIFWADPECALGPGLAYSTYEPCHLLNVRADKMGAWADGIDDFWRWLQKNRPGEFKADDFVPRMIYAEYLQEIREEFAQVPLEQTLVKSARREGDAWLLNAGKRRITARHLVLATGNPPIAGLGWPGGGKFISNFWAWRLEGHSAGGLPADGTMVIAGTGLTTADAVLSLLADGYKGRIVCVSPHGHLPEVHKPVVAYAEAERLAKELKAQPSCSNYYNAVRRHCDGQDWRGVIDSIRPHTVALWQALSEREKARFMRHLWSRWNVHRHRMAPQIRDTIAHKLPLTRLPGERAGERGTGLATGSIPLSLTLSPMKNGGEGINVIAGRIVETKEDGTVTIRLRGTDRTETIKASLVLNCTGPSYRKMVSDNPLLASLKEQGLIKPGPLGLGIETPDAPGLHAIGTLLLGERFETTAVPELRSQAVEIAQRL